MATRPRTPPPAHREPRRTGARRDPARQPWRRPRQYFGGGRELPALVPDGCIDMGLLASLDFLLRRHGHSAAPQRMRYDRRYAFERLALAHACNDEALRQLALVLFDIYTGTVPDSA